MTVMLETLKMGQAVSFSAELFFDLGAATWTANACPMICVWRRRYFDLLLSLKLRAYPGLFSNQF